MIKKTHTCGQLRAADVGKKVNLAGWVHSYRDHGNLVFVDLRGRDGLVQLVFDPDTQPEAHKLARGLRCEWVIAVTGLVRPRSEGMANSKLATGEIEVIIEQIEVLNSSITPPFEIDNAEKVSEETRLENRYIDLRRPAMLKNLHIRHRVTKIVRDYFDKAGFWEVETPMLAKSTPEGARDFLVPSRLYKGCFYALPQSPQLFKQILMVSGVEKYFQIVRCFRDEDPRADRQAEFTQIDVEMSFVDRDDVIGVHEKMVAEVWEKILGVKVPLPMPRITFEESMRDFGTDRPDIRFDMKLKDISDVAGQCEFRLFNTVVKGGGIVKGLCVPGGSKYSRSDIEKTLTNFVGDYGAKGLAWFKVNKSEKTPHPGGAGLELASSIAKFFSLDQQKQITERFKANDGDLILLVAGDKATVNKALAPLRIRLSRELKLFDTSTFSFLWVIDFPLFEWNEDEHRFDCLHHPFTSPVPEDLEKLQTDPAGVCSQAYDMVVNGSEIGGGSIRIHNPKVQQKVFGLLNISKQEAEDRFGFFLRALGYGAPPHGGIAFGLDRMIMLLAGTDNIRDVIAFPKTQRGQCLLTDAPSPVRKEQLDELNLKTQSHHKA